MNPNPPLSRLPAIWNHIHITSHSPVLNFEFIFTIVTWNLVKPPQPVWDVCKSWVSVQRDQYGFHYFCIINSKSFCFSLSCELNNDNHDSCGFSKYHFNKDLTYSSSPLLLRLTHFPHWLESNHYCLPASFIHALVGYKPLNCRKKQLLVHQFQEDCPYSSPCVSVIYKHTRELLTTSRANSKYLNLRLWPNRKKHFIHSPNPWM